MTLTDKMEEMHWLQLCYWAFGVGQFIGGAFVLLGYDYNPLELPRFFDPHSRAIFMFVNGAVIIAVLIFVRLSKLSFASEANIPRIDDKFEPLDEWEENNYDS